MWEVCIGYVFWTLEERVELSKGSASWHAETQGFESLEKFEVFSITGWGIDLDYCDIEWFALEMNGDHSVIFEIASKYCISLLVQFSSVQSLSSVWLFATPWIAECQASLSITNSRSSLKLTSIESVMPSSHLILCRPLLLLPPIPPRISLFQWVNSLHEVAKVLEFQLQHQSFQWTPRADLL